MKNFLKKLLSKIGNGILIGIGIILSIGIFFVVYAYNWNTLPNVGVGSGLTSSAWNNMIENINYLKLNSVASESFLGQISNNTAIIINDGGYSQFAEVQNSNSSVFEVVSTGNYGIKIKKAGKIMFNYDQDIKSSGGARVGAYGAIDGVNIIYTLQSPTGGVRDGFHIGGVYNVTAGQVLTIQWVNASTDIIGLDGGAWGRLGIIWVGNP